MTHRLGRGTANVAVNLCLEEARILGRIAFDRHQSRGELIRHLLTVGLQAEAPERARQIIEVRRRHKAITMLGVGLIAAALTMLPGGDWQWMRCTRRPGREFEEAA